MSAPVASVSAPAAAAAAAKVAPQFRDYPLVLLFGDSFRGSSSSSSSSPAPFHCDEIAFSHPVVIRSVHVVAFGETAEPQWKPMLTSITSPAAFAFQLFAVDHLYNVDDGTFP